MKEEPFYSHFPRFKFNFIHDQPEENLPYTWNDFNGWIGSSCIPEDFISSLSSPKSKTCKNPIWICLCVFSLPKKNAFLTGVDKILPQSHKRRTTANTTTNKYNTRYEAWGPIVERWWWPGFLDHDEEDVNKRHILVRVPSWYGMPAVSIP